MPKTPNGSLNAYASPADFAAYYDVNLFGDLVRDDGTRATPNDLLTDQNLVRALMRASGKLEASALKGRRYDAQDLQSLTGVSQEYLKWLTCCLAAIQLRQRRANLEESNLSFTKEVNQAIEDLRNGEEVFAFVETEAAGVPSTVSMNPYDWQALRLITNNVRIFGDRVVPQSAWGPPTIF